MEMGTKIIFNLIGFNKSTKLLIMFQPQQELININLQQYSNLLNSMNSTVNQVATDKKNRRILKNLTIQITKPFLKTDANRALQESNRFSSPKTFPENIKKQSQAQARKKQLHSQIYTTKKFSDLYEKQYKLGEGAHSVVYKCQQKKTRKNFAVKIFKNCDSQQIKSIKESFLIMKQLDHPYILRAESLMIDEELSNCYFISEICNYEDLRAFIETERRNRNTIPQGKICNLIKKVLMALDYLKRKGVCHRDIKPENILYNPQDQQVKIIDFELSKMKKYQHQNLELWTDTGSLFYRAPESFKLGYSETVDIWAVGVIAYQLLVRKLPFFSNSIKSVTDQICLKNLDFDSLQLSKQAKHFLKRILEKDPKKRLTPIQSLKQFFILKNPCMKEQKQLKVQRKETAEWPKMQRQHKQPEINEKYFDEIFRPKLLRSFDRNIGIIIVK